MTRNLRALVVLIALVATSAGLVGTAQAATAFNGKRCTIVGTQGHDVLHGTAGNDVICGFGGDDDLYGMGGNDVIDGGYGEDWIWGGSGTDLMSGGPDTDTVFYDDHPSGVRVVMDAKPDSGTGAEHDTIGSTVENVVGSKHNDTIIGNRFTRNTLYGNDGDDLLESPQSSDNRTVYGDWVYGGRGVDEVTYAWITDPHMPVGVRVDNKFGDGGERYVKDNVYDDVEIVRGGSGNDRLFGNQYSNELIGGPGDDLLQGLGGPDYLYGESGRDTASYAEKSSGVGITMNDLDDDGTPGEKDYVDASVESLTLGAGNDAFRGGSLPMTVVGGSGNDILLGGSAADVLRGGPGNDHLEGNGGDDNESGDGDNDVVGGGAGRDLLYGANGDDKLSGGSGNDRLHGELGSDAMDGGDGTNVCDTSGADTYTGCQLVANVADTVPVITGHVVDGKGSPIAGAGVTGAGITITTAADGSFAAPFGSDGRFDLRRPATATEPMENFRSTQAFTGDTADVTLSLPETQTASIHVTDQHGDPVAGAVADLSGSAYPSGSGAEFVAGPDASLNAALSAFTPTITLGLEERTTDAGGSVAVPVIGPEIPYLRIVRNDPHAGLVSSPVETHVAFGSTPLERSLDLTSAHLVVTLQDRLGNPFSGISFTNQNPFYGSGTSDVDGKVVLDVPKRADTWTVGTSGAPLVGVIDMTAGDRTLTLTLPQANRTVHVQGSDGQPLADATVIERAGNVSVSVSPDLSSFSTNQPSCLLCNNVAATTTTDSNGDVSIPALGIGSLQVVTPGPVSGTRVLTEWTAMTESETLTVDTRDGRTSGVVTDGAGRAFPGVKVEGRVDATPTQPTGSYDGSVTTNDGAFTVHGVPSTTRLAVSGTLVPGLPRTFQFAETNVSPREDLAVELHPVPLVVHVVDVSGHPVGAGFVLRASGSMTSSFWPGGPQIAGSWSDDLHGTDSTGTVSDVALPGVASSIQVNGGGHYGLVTDVAISPTGATLTVRLSF